MKTGIVIGFVVGFFVGPLYFNNVYPFLYHLVRPKEVLHDVGKECFRDLKMWVARDGVCYSADRPIEGR